jgi:hypothetical protein
MNQRNRDVLHAGRGHQSADALNKFRKPLLCYLASACDDPDKWVRYLAAEMLGVIGDPGAPPCLVQLLADSDEDVRTAAAKALDCISTSHHISALLHRSSCDSCLMRIIAEEALACRQETNRKCPEESRPCMADERGKYGMFTE